jgi:outer membrane immunogenic protein
MFRVTILSAAMVVAAVAPALAQPSGEPSWTGAYAGVNLGAGVGELNYPYSGMTLDGSNFVSGKFHQSSSGGLIGGQIGYDFQMHNGAVLGLVADLDGSTVAGDSNGSSTDSAGNAYTSRLKTQIDALGTVRGRLGMPMFGGRVLPYITGGLAYGGVSTTASQTCSTCADGGAASAYASQYDNRTGWTAGAGVDYALNRHLSLRTEYLYTDLGKQNLADGVFSAPGISIDNALSSVAVQANVVRVGVNYKF